MRYLTSLGHFLRAASLIVGNTLILLILCVAAGEWWARSVAPLPVAEATKVTVQNQHAAYHPWAGYRNTPGFRYELGNWVPIVINSWGWRGPEPTIARSKSVKRAMLVGDSVGFSCWGCREEVSLGGALKRALEVRTAEEWEVINVSVGGGFSSTSLGTLAHDAIQFQPDVVMTLNGNNDILVLDDRTMLQMGVGRFKHSLYHTSQVTFEDLYDPRTGKIQQSGLLDQLVAKSALFRLASSSPLFAKVRSYEHGPERTAVPRAPTSEGYSTAHQEYLDTYVNNQLAMSYLAQGSGAKFVGFLQPYLSAKNKIMGDKDRAAVKKIEPSLLTWIDDMFPVLRSKLQKAAAAHPSYNFVDLSQLFIREQVFDDLVHMTYESLERSNGNEIMAGRMADEVVKVYYPGKSLPDWRASHIEGTPYDWQEKAYLAANPDVPGLIADGKFKSGFDHYRNVGFLEFRRGGFPSWSEKEYRDANPDIAPLIEKGAFASGYEHYVLQGKAEGRRIGLPFRWTEETYLAANPDVAAAVKAGKFKSGEDHYMKAGAKEDRRGGFSGWDEWGYIIPYADVRNAVIGKIFSSGFEHYVAAGKKEGRDTPLGLTVPH